MSYQSKLISCLLILIIILSVIDYTNLDIKLQSLFFNFETKKWLVERDDQLLKILFYRLPKYIIIIYGVYIIFWLAKLKHKNEDYKTQRKLLYLVLNLVLVPVTIALLKRFSPIYCPNHIVEFYGSHKYISPFDIFNSDIYFNNFGKCSPAGHASGGFALLSLYFVAPTKKLQQLAVFLALFMGSAMGLYQLAKGTHYLSDTLITLAVAYLIAITLEKFMLKTDKVNK